MTGEELLKQTAALERYLAGFDGCFGRSELRGHFRLFARGQMGPIERKSLEPISDAAGEPPRGLQQFFSQYKWDEEKVRDQLQRKVAEKYGGADGIFIIDETSDAKKGAWNNPYLTIKYDYESRIVELFGILVGNLDSEFLFESHDELDGVERISSEVLDEGGIDGDLFSGHAELLDDDVADFFFDGFFRHGCLCCVGYP